MSISLISKYSVFGWLALCPHFWTVTNLPFLGATQVKDFEWVVSVMSISL